MNIEQAIIQAGYPPHNISPDGKFHRWSEGRKSGERNLWAINYSDKFGAFGSWRTGERYNWKLDNKELTKEEIKQIQADIQKAEQEREKLHLQKAKEAEKYFNRLSIKDYVSKYLTNKNVGTYGIKFGKNYLVIPIRDIEGKIWSYQKIFDGGKKSFFKDGKKKGNFHLIGVNSLSETSEAYIAEGYATAATIHEITNKPVIIAFDCYNFKNVIQAINEKYSTICLTIFSDNDIFKPENNGLREGKDAANQYNIPIIYPKFNHNDFETKPSDFNDLVKLKGEEEARRQILSQQESKFINILNWNRKKYEGEPEPRKWLVKDLIPLGVPFLLAGKGGIGKSYLSLALAASVANCNSNNSAFLADSICTEGKVFYFSAEDDKNEIHKRLNQLGIKANDNLFIVPLPDAGNFSVMARKGSDLIVTEEYKRIYKQLLEQDDIALIIFDPLQVFAQAEIDRDNVASQFMMNQMRELATATGSTVLISHHMRKEDRSAPIKTSDDAREAIRGASGLVDGVRGAIAIWQNGKNLKAALVKSNFGGNTEKTFDLKRDVKGYLIEDKVTKEEEKTAIFNYIVLNPKEELMKSGKKSVFANREKIGGKISKITKARSEKIIEELINEGRLCKGDKNKLVPMTVFPNRNENQECLKASVSLN
jgi:putative DNA primase/helicase